jgi:FixJ family two-component response regulator
MMAYCGKEASSKKECTIFIVDDDQSLCRALARLLKAAGYRSVRTFSSAEAFMQEASLNSCSVIILDIQLPGMSGLDLMESVRSLGHTMPVILISAHDEQLSRARDMQHECTAFLHKPFEEAELVSVISSFTGQ